MQLVDLLADPQLREPLLAACESALEEEVAAKRGVTGVAIRSGYGGFKKLQPGIVREAFGKLLPAFAPVLDPHWAAARQSGDAPGYFVARAEEVAESMLQVTDGMAERARNQVLVGIYRSLRGMAQPHVVAAVPRIPGILAAVTPVDRVV